MTTSSKEPTHTDTTTPTTFRWPSSSRRSNNHSHTLSSFSSSSSLSSPSSSRSSSPSEDNLSPLTTPLHHQYHCLPSSTKAHIPFSWEHLPGIPKTPIITPQLLTKSSSRHPKPTLFIPNSNSSSSAPNPCNFLPLPPSSSNSNHHRTKEARKKNDGHRTGSGQVLVGSESLIWRDPFLAALLECSKDTSSNTNMSDHHDESGWKDGKKGARISVTTSDRIGNIMNISLYQFSCKRTSGVSESIVPVLPRSRKFTYDDRHG